MTLVKYVNVFNATYQSLLNASEQGILANIYRFSKLSHCSHSFCCDTGARIPCLIIHLLLVLPVHVLIFLKLNSTGQYMMYNTCVILIIYWVLKQNLAAISLQHAVDGIERASEYKNPSEYESAKMFADMKSTNIPFGVLPMERGRL